MKGKHMGKEQHSELIIEMTPFVEEICGKDISVSVLDAAQKYYRELVAENATEPKAMYPHTRNRIYPGVAVFRALTDIGIERSRAAEMFRKFYRQRAEKPAKKIRSLLKIPGLYKLMPKIFRFVMQKNFGEDAGFKASYYETAKGEFRADMLVCPYMEICRKYGCTEIVPTFCETDDVAYGNMHPCVIWGRTKTLGKGGDCCDFKLTVVKKEKRNER